MHPQILAAIIHKKRNRLCAGGMPFSNSTIEFSWLALRFKSFGFKLLFPKRLVNSSESVRVCFLLYVGKKEI